MARATQGRARCATLLSARVLPGRPALPRQCGEAYGGPLWGPGRLLGCGAARGNESGLIGNDDRLDAIAHAELKEDPGDVGFDRGLADD